MNYNEFISSIRKREILPVYFFIGNEEYLMNKALEKIKEEIIDVSFETLNYITIDNKESKFDNILNACETLPFMSSKKLVVVKDISEIYSNSSSDIDTEISSYIEGIGDYVILIIMDRTGSLKKTTKLYKTINKLKGIVEFNKLKGRDLNLWIETRLKLADKKISGSNLNYFLDLSTYDEYNSNKTLYDLENELVKLINYSTNKEITREDVDLVLTRSLDKNIFNLLSSINKKDSGLSLKIFNEMYLSNEPVQKILIMIIRQLRLLLGYKLYKGKGYSDTDIQEKLKIKPYEFKKISKESYNFTEDKLMKSLEYILELDIRQKTTSQDEKLSMEMLITNLIYI